jgi:hypothetical protein
MPECSTVGVSTKREKVKMATKRWFGLIDFVGLACLLFGNMAWAAEGASALPGVVIAYSSERDVNIGSPSLAILPSGDYVASHDIFGRSSNSGNSRVFRSRDKGRTWTHLADLEGQFWSSLFVHRDVLYLMGTNKKNGDCVIRRSEDGGATWTMPVDEKSGMLFNDARYHCAPMPVLEHQGRLWRAMEDREGRESRGGAGGWANPFRSMVLSVSVDADLLDASQWTRSSALPSEQDWLDGQFGGWLEGNAVATPEGNVVNILRADRRPQGGKAAVIEISADGKTATFDPATGFIDFPGGCKKFSIRRDAETGFYWSLSNYMQEKDRNDIAERIRNTLALLVSKDLRRWTVASVVLYHDDVKHVGFQYADWLFDGDDIVAVVRTSYPDGTAVERNYHDANYMTFHRIENFRQWAPR